MNTKQTNLVPAVGLKIPISDAEHLRWDKVSKSHIAIIHYNGSDWVMHNPETGKGMFVFVNNYFAKSTHILITGITTPGTACYAKAITPL